MHFKTHNWVFISYLCLRLRHLERFTSAALRTQMSRSRVHSLFLQMEATRRSPPPHFRFAHELCKDPPLALGGWTVFLCLCSPPVPGTWTPIRTRIKCPHLITIAPSSNSCTSVASTPRLVFSCDGVREMSRSNFLSLFSQLRFGIKLRPQKEATMQQFFLRGTRVRTIHSVKQWFFSKRSGSGQFWEINFAEAS